MKTSKITALVIAGLTATTIAGVALAEGPGGMGMMRGGPMAGLDFAAVDADKDGKITVAEMTAHRAARFAAADTDKDGKLNEAELAAMMLAQAEARIKAGSARMLAYMDTDGDKLLSAEEMPQGRGEGRMFARLDADGDGALSAAELENAGEQMGRDGKRRGDGSGHGGWWGWDDN